MVKPLQTIPEEQLDLLKHTGKMCNCGDIGRKCFFFLLCTKHTIRRKEACYVYFGTKQASFALVVPSWLSIASTGLAKQGALIKRAGVLSNAMDIINSTGHHETAL